MKETVKGTAMAAASIAKHRDNKLMAWKQKEHLNIIK